MLAGHGGSYPVRPPVGVASQYKEVQIPAARVGGAGGHIGRG